MARERRSQLWLAAIDLSATAPAGSDPSRAPLWLPFQDLRHANLLPAWSAQVPCVAGGAAGCGAGAACVAGFCAPTYR